MMRGNRVIPNTIRIKTKISEKDIYRLLLSVFAFFVVFTPVDVFVIKKISLIILLLLSVKYIIILPPDGFHRIISIFGFWITGISIIVSSILTSDIFGNVVQGYMGFILLLFYLIEYKNIDFSIIFKRVLLLLAIFICFMSILDITGIVPMQANDLLSWMSENEIAYVGKHAGLVTGYMIFVKTSPLLVIVVPSFYEEKRYFAVIICIVALFLSGTRANIIIGLASLIICILLKKHKSTFEKSLLLILVAVVIFVLYKGSIIEYVKSMFALKVNDDSLRDSTLKSILSGFHDNPVSLLIGNGYTSSFYNEGTHSYNSIVELSYWNLLRQVGLFLFLPMLFTYLYPAFKLVKEKKSIPIAIAYLGYLIIAYTNPLLYSTTGLLGLLYMFYITYIDCYHEPL